MRVANGDSLTCSQQLPATAWSVHGYTFYSNLKVLPLASYDMIIGMDWLEAHSPMKVHWKEKWMTIPYKGSSTFLQGHRDGNSLVGEVFAVFQLSPDVPPAPTSIVHPEIQALLHEFGDVFAPPDEQYTCSST